MKKHPTYSDVCRFRDNWTSLSLENIKKMNLSLHYLSGEGQKEFLNSALKDREKLVLNYIFKLAEREKAELADFDLNLKVSSLGSGIPSKMKNSAQAILEDILLSSEHLDAFKTSLKKIYDCGFSALGVFPEKDHLGTAHLKIVNFSNPSKVFFDPRAQSLLRTDGDFCGVEYYSYDDSGRSLEMHDIFYFFEEKRTLFVSDGGQVFEKKPQGIASHLVKEEEREVKSLYHQRFKSGSSTGITRVGITKHLPFVYIPAARVDVFSPNSISLTYPYAYNLISAQNLLNFVTSSIVEQTKKALRDDVILIPADYLSQQSGSKGGIIDTMLEGGVIAFDMKQTEGDKQPPQVLPANSIDPSLINVFNLANTSLTFLSGFSPAQEGLDKSSTTGAANRAKKSGAQFFKKIVMENLSKGVLRIGEILKDLIPIVYSEGHRMFPLGDDAVKINVYGEPSLEEIFKKHDVFIDLAFSDSESKEFDLASFEKLVQVLPSNDPQLRQMIAYILADTLKGKSVDIIKRFVEAGLDDETLQYIKGFTTRKEYQDSVMKKLQEQQAKPPPPDPVLEKLKIEKTKVDVAMQKAQMEAQLKQQKLALEEEKMKEDMLTKQQELRIKEAEAVLPKTENIRVEK